MYNFGPPAQFKAYIDNIVRVGRTFGFDRGRDGEPYWPLLADSGKRLVILSSRGDYGYQADGRIGHRNHVESSVRTAFAYIGVTDVHEAAIEDRKSTRLNSITNAHLVCRLLLVKKKNNK